MRKIAIIGGTGIDNPELMGSFEKKIIETPYGKALCNIGMMNDNQVVFVSRHGVDHSVPPSKVNYRANIWSVKSLGTEEIFATTAVGSLNPEMKAGHFVVCDNVLDFTKNRVNTFYDSPERGVAHCDFTYPYCPCLREKVIKCLEKTDITFHKQGVYVCTEGPRFESAAEIKMYAMLGGDEHKEDGMTLFGFSDEDERRLFLELIKVNGIGPKQAMKILSGVKVRDFISALDQSDVSFLSRIPGLGAKTSQKIILALRDTLVFTEEASKPQNVASGASKKYQDIIDALVEMGYDKKKVLDTVAKLLKENDEYVGSHSQSSVEEWLFRSAVVALS